MRQIFSDIKSIPSGIVKLFKCLRFVFKAIFNSHIVWEEKFEGDNSLQRWWDNTCEDWTYRIISFVVCVLLFFVVVNSSWCSTAPLYK